MQVCHGTSDLAGQTWQKSQMHISLQKRSTRKRSAQAEAACPWEWDCWILLLGYSQLIFTHPALLFSLIFQCLSKMGLFHFASCFHPNWSMFWFKANRQSSNHILSYQMWCMEFPTFTQRGRLTAVRLDITWGLIQRQSMDCLLYKAQMKDMS